MKSLLSYPSLAQLARVSGKNLPIFNKMFSIILKNLASITICNIHNNQLRKKDITTKNPFENYRTSFQLVSKTS